MGLFILLQVVMTLVSNNELVQSLNKSDVKVFVNLYDEYSTALFRNIFKLIPHQQEAEDLLQSVFLKMWEKRQEFTEKQSVPGWLFSTSFYMTMDRLRVIARNRIQCLEEDAAEIPDSGADEIPAEIFLKKKKILHQAISLLPARKRQAFELCRIEGKSYREAAGLLNLSEETVKDYVKSAMSILRKYALQADPSLYLLLLSFSAPVFN